MLEKALLLAFSSPIGMQLVSGLNENAWYSLFAEEKNSGNYFSDSVKQKWRQRLPNIINQKITTSVESHGTLI